MEIKDASKPKKASVRFASTERDPAVNVITPSTMDLKPVMNCLKSIENRINKMKRRGQPALASTPPSRFTSFALSQSPSNQGADRQRVRRTTPATGACSSKTSRTCRRRTTPPVHSHAVPRHRQRDGEMMSVISLRRRRRAALDRVPRKRHRGGLTPARGMVALSLPQHL